MRRFLLCALLTLTTQALAFEVGEIKSGFPRERVRELLGSWKFDRVVESDDSIIAFDTPDKQTFRNFRLMFCNDRLVALEQAMKPSVRNFIVITHSYLIAHGQPIKVDAGVNVVSSGEKNAMSLAWRRGPETVGVRYLQLAGGEELKIVYEVPNTCWQTPRAP